MYGAASRQCAESPVRGTGRRKTAGPRRGHQRDIYGALDLGTNNCRLLIARPSEGGFTVLDAFSRIVRLGEGLSSSGKLSQESMDRAVEALAVCADKLRRRHVTLARSVATEACRRAVNGREFVARVKRETGIALEIISPQEEARLAVLGCHKLLEPGDGPALIFDIGGGSTELVLVEQGETASAHPRLVVGAVGRGFADRKRGPGSDRGQGPGRGLCPDARARAAELRPFRRDAARQAGECPAARHQRDGDDAGQRPPRAAGL